MTEVKEPQSKTTILIISIFLGGLGIDRLLLGHSNWWLKLITLGGCYIWWIIDIVNIATGKLKMADGRDLK